MRTTGYGMISGGPVTADDAYLRIAPHSRDQEHEDRQRRATEMSGRLAQAQKQAKSGGGTFSASPEPWRPGKPGNFSGPRGGHRPSRAETGEATREAYRAMVEEYAAGSSSAAVGRKYGVSPRTVTAWARELGVQVRPAAALRRHDLDAATMVRQYREGMGLEEIARAHGCGKTTVRKRLIAAGVTLRPAHVNTSRREAR